MKKMLMALKDSILRKKKNFNCTLDENFLGTRNSSVVQKLQV